MFFFGFSAEVQAQESSGIKVAPAVIEERVEPGQVFSSILRITNLDSVNHEYYIFTRDIKGLSPQGEPIFSDKGEETGFEIASWIKIAKEPIFIGGGKTKEIPFTIEVPKNAGPGGHFGAIFSSLQPIRAEKTGAAVAFQVATIVNLRISGTILEEAQIREFRSSGLIYGKPEVKFISRVENIGNVFLRPRGPLEITDMFGKKVATIIMNNDAAAVFPKTVRQFEAYWKGEGLAFGRYQAIISLAYGNEEIQTVSASTSFWVLPVNIILPVILGLLGLVLAIFILVKLLIRRKLRELENTAKNSEISVRRKTLPSPFPLLLSIALALLLLTILFLALLFVFFA